MPEAATSRPPVCRLGLRSVRLEQEAGEVIRREEGPVRAPGLPQEGLPAQEVVVAQQDRWCAPGEMLTHGGSRVAVVHQITADE